MPLAKTIKLLHLLANEFFIYFKFTFIGIPLYSAYLILLHLIWSPYAENKVITWGEIREILFFFPAEYVLLLISLIYILSATVRINTYIGKQHE